jgi:hypothetical protein
VATLNAFNRDVSEIREMKHTRVRYKDCLAGSGFARLACDYCSVYIQEYHKNEHGAIKKLMGRCNGCMTIGDLRCHCCPNCLALNRAEGVPDPDGERP